MQPSRRDSTIPSQGSRKPGSPWSFLPDFDASVRGGERHCNRSCCSICETAAAKLGAFLSARRAMSSDINQSVNSAQIALQYKAMDAAIEIQRRTSSRVMIGVSQTIIGFHGGATLLVVRAPKH